MASKDTKDNRQNIRENNQQHNVLNNNPYYNMMDLQLGNNKNIFNQTNQQSYLNPNSINVNYMQSQTSETQNAMRRNQHMFQYPSNETTLNALMSSLTYYNQYELSNQASSKERVIKEGNINNTLNSSVTKASVDIPKTSNLPLDNKQGNSTTKELENLQKQIDNIKQCNDLQMKTLSVLANSIQILSDQVIQHKNINEEYKKKICISNPKPNDSSIQQNLHQSNIQLNDTYFHNYPNINVQPLNNPLPYQSNQNMPLYSSNILNHQMFGPK